MFSCNFGPKDKSNVLPNEIHELLLFIHNKSGSKIKSIIHPAKGKGRNPG
jgi:hypothetical protein